MTLTRSGRSVTCPAKYVNADIVLMRPAPLAKPCLVVGDSKLRQPVNSTVSSGDGRSVMTAEGKKTDTGTDAGQNLPVSRLKEGKNMVAVSSKPRNPPVKNVNKCEAIDGRDYEERTLVIAEDFVNRKECTGADSLLQSSQQIFIYSSSADECKR
jgi:hypothetical protein